MKAIVVLEVLFNIVANVVAKKSDRSCRDRKTALSTIASGDARTTTINDRLSTISTLPAC
ncbi:MAG: hypothetical protein HC786_29465 [Richelia sp. CSU_2_1]|nr:hypothetical protein [Richelia sp. CSU_2_1]